MSGLGRPSRAATRGVNYREPGDDPELSELEDSSDNESVLDSSIVAGSESDQSVLLDSTVVIGGAPVGEPLCGSTPNVVVPTTSSPRASVVDAVGT